MSKLLSIVLIILVNFLVFSQEALKMQGEAAQVLSGEKQELTGILSKPKFSPYPSQVFAFVRQFAGNQYLYTYDLGAKSLTKIRTVLPGGGINISVEDSIRQAVVFNGQLDWRPRLDEQEQQWFAFVSNGTQNNRDVYIGFVGGSNHIRLTVNEAIDSNPKWSPDGNSIAFISTRSGDGDIYLIDAVDKIIAELNRNVQNVKLTQITDTPMRETNLAWNPDPKASLLAFARQKSFEGREVPTFQIRVMDLKSPELSVLNVTDDPLYHYTRPLWDPHAGNRLLYVGQSLLDNFTANLYLTELVRGGDGKLQNKILEGYKTEVFKNVALDGAHAVWLAGGEAIICQENRPEQNYPIYSVNIDKWLEKKEGAVDYFEDLHSAFPYISDYDVRKNNLIFVTRQGEHFEIYLAQIYGDDIIPDRLPAFKIAAAKTSGGVFDTKYLIAGGAVTAGVVAYLLLRDTSPEEATIESIPIGRPPSMP